VDYDDRTKGKRLPMDLGRLIREQIRDALQAAARRQGGRRTRSAGSVNIASATNVNSSGRTVSVYSDDDVTIIKRDGETQVIRHDEERDRAAGGDDDLA
jgi:hypothetical protein